MRCRLKSLALAIVFVSVASVLATEVQVFAQAPGEESGGGR